MNELNNCQPAGTGSLGNSPFAASATSGPIRLAYDYDLYHPASCSRVIGEALRLAGAIEAMGVTRVVHGRPEDWSLAVRLVDLVASLDAHAEDGEAAAALVHRQITSIVRRIEIEAMEDAVGRIHMIAHEIAVTDPRVHDVAGPSDRGSNDR